MLPLLWLAVCSSPPAGDPTPPEPEKRLLAELGRALGADPTDQEVERISPPECSDDYDRVIASASYDGVRVSVDRVIGTCPDGDRGYFACDGVPRQEGHAVELRSCFTRTLDDGEVLVAGLLVVHQESESFLAAVVRPDRRCVVAADRDAGVTLETLADAAAEIRCE